MKSFLVLVLLLAVVSLTAGSQQSAWMKFESTPGQFSVLLPVEPREEKKSHDSPHGPYATVLYIPRRTQNFILSVW